MHCLVESEKRSRFEVQEVVIACLGGRMKRPIQQFDVIIGWKAPLKVFCRRPQRSEGRFFLAVRVGLEVIAERT